MNTINLCPWAERIAMPEQVRAGLVDAVKGVTREQHRRVSKEDMDKFVEACELAVRRYFVCRGKWAKGPRGVIPVASERYSKTRPTRTDYTGPLQQIAAALDKIDKQLALLPMDGIGWIEAGAGNELAQCGIADAFPPRFLVMGDAPEEGAVMGDAREDGPFSCETSPLHHWQFLLRLHAIRQGVSYAMNMATWELPATKERDWDTPRLVRDVADAYRVNLGRRPTTNGRGIAPFTTALGILFAWVADHSKGHRLSDERILSLAKAALRELPKRPRVR